MALAGLVLLAPAATVHAHAVLGATSPSAGELVADPPHAITLSFNERVSLALGGVDVFAPSGSAVVREGGRASGPRVTVPLRATQRGTYAVSWRVLSADGHPVRGAFVFSAGERSASTVATRRAQEVASTDRVLALSLGVVRFIYILGVLVAAGGAIFAAIAAPRFRLRFVRPALLVVIAGSVAGFVLEAAHAAGTGLAGAFDVDLLQAQLSTLYGNAAIVRVALALLALAALRIASPLGSAGAGIRAMTVAVFAALAMSTSIAGHAMATSPIALRVPLDMLHVLFAAAWIGGLVQLYRYCRSEDVQSRCVVRYSYLALTCVVVLVATGAFATLVESDLSLSALVGSTYGLILAIKIGLFALALPCANLNRIRHVPAIVAGEAGSGLALRRFVRYEILVLTGAVVMTAWLIDTTPARHAVASTPATPAPVSATRTLPSGTRATFRITPGATGPNQITVTLRRPDGHPDGSPDELKLTAGLAGRGIDRLPIKLVRLPGARWRATTAVLPLAGGWSFDLAIRRGDFDQETTRFDADIRALAPTTAPTP